MAIDIIGLSYFMPLFIFLFIFAIIFAVLNKIKVLGDNQFAHLLVSFIIAIIFATTTNTQEYIQTITPWAIIFVVCIFFILIIIAMSQQKFEIIFKPGVVWVIVIVLIFIFLISANKVFSNLLLFENIKNTVDSNARVVGGLLLVATAAIVSWILTKK
jgi:hypothetical protein